MSAHFAEVGSPYWLRRQSALGFSGIEIPDDLAKNINYGESGIQTYDSPVCESGLPHTGLKPRC